MKKAALAALAAAAAIVPAAGAITGGTLDGAAHPNVGIVVARQADGSVVPLCSATLVAPRVVLTAAHCLSGLSVSRVLVSFDSVFEPASASFVGGGYAVDPAYGQDRKDAHDLGVVLLDAAPAGVEPAALPAAGALDGLAKGTTFTNVGYGDNDRVTGGGAPRFLYDGARRFSVSAFGSEDATTLQLKNGADGGVCFGDSGGPRLLGNVVAAVTTAGNSACTGESTAYRLDTASARAFLSRFVPLP